jgi:hypothetical protein
MTNSENGFLTNSFILSRSDSTRPIIAIDTEGHWRVAMDNYLIVPREFFTEDELQHARDRWLKK